MIAGGLEEIGGAGARRTERGLRYEITAKPNTCKISERTRADNNKKKSISTQRAWGQERRDEREMKRYEQTTR